MFRIDINTCANWKIRSDIELEIFSQVLSEKQRLQSPALWGKMDTQLEGSNAVARVPCY